MFYNSPTRKRCLAADADVAQSVVHRIGSAGVSSSILDISTKESLENTEENRYFRAFLFYTFRGRFVNFRYLKLKKMNQTRVETRVEISMKVCYIIIEIRTYV